ncbi:MAG: Crp/Fnr family transcriptional regulator [Bdellovibrionales bacterium]|nr:Crp/Fnr family transcriptional regulator [Bdellovibrionales bacterium]
MSSNLRELGLISELRGLELFRSSSENDIEQLCKDSQVVITNHKQLLFKAGSSAQHFYLVLSGAFKLTRLSLQGEDTIVHFSSPGDVIGAFIMTQKDPRYPISGVSMGPSRSLKIPRTNYLTSWQNNIDLNHKIQNSLSSRMTALQNQMTLKKSSLQTKIACLLIQLANKQTEDQKQLLVPIPLTRREIAEAVGASVESVIRIMSLWSKRGYVSTNEQCITILETEKIIELTEKDC